MAQSVKND